MVVGGLLTFFAGRVCIQRLGQMIHDRAEASNPARSNEWESARAIIRSLEAAKMQCSPSIPLQSHPFWESRA